MRLILLVSIILLTITSCSESAIETPGNNLTAPVFIVPVSEHFSTSMDIDATPIVEQKEFYRKLIENEYSVGMDTLYAIAIANWIPDSIRLQAQFNLAKWQYWNGYWDASIDNLKKVINSYSSIYGEMHPNVAYAKGFIQKVFYKKNQCDEAEKMAFEALDLLKKNPDNYNYIIHSEIYLGLGYYYKCRENYPQMKAYCQKAHDIAKEYKEPTSVPKRGWALIELANAGLAVQDYWEAIDYFQLAITVFEGYPDNRYHPDNGISTIHNDLGYCFNKVGMFDQSIKFLSKAVERNFHHSSIKKSHPGTAANFKNIAYAFAAIGDLDRARIQYETALEILKFCRQDLIERTSLVKLGLIELLYKQKNLEGAEMLALSTLQIEKQQKRQNNIRTTALLYQWLGKIYLKKDEAAKAENEFSKATSIFSKLSLGTQQHVYTHFLEISKTYIEVNEFEKALKLLLPLYEKVRKSNFPNKDELTLNIGKCHLALMQLEDAKTWLERTNRHSGYNLDNPDRLRTRYNLNFFSDFLLARSNYYELNYQISQDKFYLDSAIIFLEDAANYLYEQRPNLHNSAFINEVFNPLQERLIQLYEEQQAPDMLSNIFRQFEQSKAVRLLHSAKKRSVKDFTGLPNTIPPQINELESKIAFYETKLKMYPDETPNFTPKLEVAIQQFDLLRDDIKQKYPAYYDYRFKHQTITIEEVQEQLEQGEAALVYFWGTESVKAILITSKEVQLRTVGNITLVKKSISLLLEGIEQSRKSNSQSNRYLQQYVNQATGLYQTLILPFNELLQKSIDRLTIIADGPITSIPFGALLLEAPEDLRLTQYFDYLINRYSISIGYSATFQFSSWQKAENLAKYPYVGFAPFLSASKTKNRNISILEQEEVGGLPFSKLEVTEANSIFGGMLFLDSLATRKTFLKFAPSAGILHCATHAIGDAQNGGLGYLLFSVDARVDTSEQLYAREVYNMDLNAKLVILSACQSAKGSYLIGEGVESIAYAFSNAGAKSVCATYWNLNDEGSYQLLSLFFDALKNGFYKDKALQLAQLQFIKKYRLKSHPYYWSVFHLYGDPNPLVLQ